MSNTEPTELQKLQWQNQAYREALKYLVETKKRKEAIGEDSIYKTRESRGWIQAENLLNEFE